MARAEKAENAQKERQKELSIELIYSFIHISLTTHHPLIIFSFISH
jgi:hypothetical protein